MSVFFELMDRSSGNVIEDYETEEAALEELRRVGRDYGFDEIRDLALLKFQDGRPTLVAMEDELIARVKATDDKGPPNRSGGMGQSPRHGQRPRDGSASPSPATSSSRTKSSTAP